MKYMAILIVISISMLWGCSRNITENKGPKSDYPIQGIPFYNVQVRDNFWLPKIETNRKATIPASFKKCEEMGRLENFLLAGGKMKGKVWGEMPFDDTDVYKIIEGASYSLTTFPDPELDAYVDSLIAIITIGQEEDGYLTTWKTIDSTVSPAAWCDPGGRWKNLHCSHELYNSGHMFEAAAAHYLATNKRNFLDIALKNADLLVEVFGEGKNPQVPGHQIVETGLIKLYLITKKKEYLDLARHFLDQRGDSTLRETWGPYNQDHMPVTQQTEAVGHAVRAAYMYAGMTDIAALFEDEAYKNAIQQIWENVVYKKIYLTGGIGARHRGESFGDNYELPNLTAYNETCAAIANVYWNYRMFLLFGDGRYMDVLERSLYNGVISGVSLDGTLFFYPNPLECNMEYAFNSGNTLTRQPWFDCSCCPTNLCRFMPSVPGYIYARENNKLYVNLYVTSSTKVEINNTPVTVSQETDYPWDGNIIINISPQKDDEFEVRLRIPEWVTDRPLPGDLYQYTNTLKQKHQIKVNGEIVTPETDKGYAVLSRIWNPGDRIELTLPMEVRQVRANEKVKADSGLLAMERGPIVYCVEEIDNPDIDDLYMNEKLRFNPIYNTELLNGVEVVTAGTSGKEKTFTAIPYYVWNNRGANKMKVWLPEN